MKTSHLRIYLLMILSMISFSSCEINDDLNLPDPTYNGPLINIEDGSSASYFLGQSIIYNNISITGSVGIASFRIVLDGVEIQNETYDGTTGRITSSFNFPIPDEWVNSTKTLVFEARDVRNQIVTSTVNIVVSTVEPDYDIEDVVINGQSFKKITGNINVDETLDNSSLWIISGVVNVTQQVKLTITEGTQIFAETPQTLLFVNSLGLVDWQGTATNPIVFTSLANAPGQGSGNTNRGQWTGIRIDGSGAGTNSGIVRYVRQMYAGFADNTNAFYLRGLGSGTTVEYIQVYRHLNRGVRIEGGDVNVKYLVSTNGDGVGIRLDGSWNGNGQFWIVNKDITASSAIEPRGGTPFLSNITITGQGVNSASSPGGVGLRVRNGGNAKIYRTLLTGLGDALRFSDGSEQGIAQGNSFFRDSASFGNSANNGTGFHSSANFFNPNSPEYEAVFNNTLTPITITNSYVGTGPLDMQVALPLPNSFFTNANYIGAVQAGNDWTVGWCVNIDGTLRQ